MMSYKIGEFSKINKISKRMLRYYDEKGVLSPQKDKDSGYRFYTDNDIKTIEKIKTFKNYDFSVDEIKRMLSMDSDELKTIYKKKVNELNGKAIEYSNIIDEMNQYSQSSNSDLKNTANTYDVFIGKKRAFYAICIRKVIDEEHEIEFLIEELLDAIIDLEIDSNVSGKYFGIFHPCHENNSELYDIEICQPILPTKNDSVIAKIEDNNNFKIKHFKEETYITTIHNGNYNNLNYAYAALIDWANVNKYILTGNFQEKYLTDEYVTKDSNLFVTEVSISVAKK